MQEEGASAVPVFLEMVQVEKAARRRLDCAPLTLTLLARPMTSLYDHLDRPSLKTFVQTVSRAFYEPSHVILLDQLLKRDACVFQPLTEAHLPRSRLIRPRPREPQISGG